MYHSSTSSNSYNRNYSENSLFGKQRKNSNRDMQYSQLMRLFDEELREIYWTEKALTKAIPKLINNASSVYLIDVLEFHLMESIQHVKRLEIIFELLGKKAIAKKCGAMEGLLKEAEAMMKKYEESAMCDAGIISVCQKMEHYNIATYDILWQLAKTLGLTDVLTLLQISLDEKKSAEANLTEVAGCAININAIQEEEIAYSIW